MAMHQGHIEPFSMRRRVLQPLKFHYMSSDHPKAHKQNVPCVRLILAVPMFLEEHQPAAIRGIKHIMHIIGYQTKKM